jgi:hypothetical protein
VYEGADVVTKGLHVNGGCKVIWLQNNLSASRGRSWGKRHALNAWMSRPTAARCSMPIAVISLADLVLTNNLESQLTSMPDLFRRYSNIQCFFCHSPSPLPKNPRSFRCSTCGCWNRYDDKGEILSDEPAMHDEYLNSRSFAKRGRCCLKNVQTLETLRRVSSFSQ